MVCTYNSDLFKNHCEESNKYFEDFISECTALCKTFDKLKGECFNRSHINASTCTK